MQKENVELYAAYAAEKAARAKTLLEVSAPRSENAAQKYRFEELTRRLAEKRSARERSVVERRHSEDAVVVKEKLTKQVKQMSARVTKQRKGGYEQQGNRGRL